MAQYGFLIDDDEGKTVLVDEIFAEDIVQAHDHFKDLGLFEIYDNGFIVNLEELLRFAR